jgi:ABC-type multidrug transport system permease subunit
MRPFFERGGLGYLADNTTQACEYCAYKIGDEFYSTFSMSFDTRWRDLGIFLAFIGSNLIILFLAVSLSYGCWLGYRLIYDFLVPLPELQSQITLLDGVYEERY